MNEKSKKRFEKKQIIPKAPNLSKLQPVVIDGKTIIYIDIDADPELARKRYLERQKAR